MLAGHCAALGRVRLRVMELVGVPGVGRPWSPPSVRSPENNMSIVDGFSREELNYILRLCLLSDMREGWEGEHTPEETLSK